MSRTNYSSLSDKILLKIEPSKSSILPYIFGTIFGLLLIILTISFDIRFNTLYYYLILMAIVFFLIIDRGYRQRNYIRLIELSEKSLSVYKGKKMNKETVLMSKITAISRKKRFLSISITLKVEAAEQKKASSFNISSENIKNSDLLNLFEEIQRIKSYS